MDPTTLLGSCAHASEFVTKDGPLFKRQAVNQKLAVHDSIPVLYPHLLPIMYHVLPGIAVVV